ncbi:hypothetical protein ES708_16378 [subsurface metagenome]
MCFSISAVASGEALEPCSDLTLKPFQVAGLWLAVMMIAPPACLARMP